MQTTLADADSTSNSGSDSRPRTPLVDRLTSLFGNDALAPSPHPPEQNTLADMRPSQMTTAWSRLSTHGPLSPRALSIVETRQPPTNPEPAECTSPEDYPQMDPGPSSNPKRLSLPVIRWRGSSPDARSASTSRSASPSPTRSAKASLNEALSEDIPCRTYSSPTPPPPAHLPPLLSSRNLTRPPPFLGSLTRSTLPTSSLSVPSSSQHRQSVSLDQPIAVGRPSPPSTRTSLETLRTIHTSASSSTQPSPPASRWWFQSGNKANVDSMLEEDDKADSVEAEQERIRQRCASSTPDTPCARSSNMPRC